MGLRWTLKNWWGKLWIREDEFHSSLDYSANIRPGMSEKKREQATLDLIKRRQIAHERGIERSKRA